MGDKDAEASFKPQEDTPEETLTPEVFFEHLSPIVINGEEYLFVHDLEKTFDLRMDECLSIICATHYGIFKHRPHLRSTR